MFYFNAICWELLLTKCIYKMILFSYFVLVKMFIDAILFYFLVLKRFYYFFDIFVLLLTNFNMPNYRFELL